MSDKMVKFMEKLATKPMNDKTVVKLMEKLATKLEAANRLDLRPPTQVSVEAFTELLAYDRALAHCYQIMHWKSKGSSSYGDHLLFERLYQELVNEQDTIAEKGIGYTNEEEVVNVTYQARRSATYVDLISGSNSGQPFDGTFALGQMLHAEKHFVTKFIPKILVDMENATELGDDAENFLQGVADAHTKAIYLLQQRLRGLNEQTVQQLPSPVPAPTAPITPPQEQQPVVDEQDQEQAPDVPSEEEVLKNLQNKAAG